jgi:hypothetical protein
LTKWENILPVFMRTFFIEVFPNLQNSRSNDLKH